MEHKLEEMLELLRLLLALHREQATQKTHYSTAEAAKRLGKAEFTIQQYCRQGILRAQKSAALSGPYSKWVIPSEELARFEREGPLSRRPAK